MHADNNLPGLYVQIWYGLMQTEDGWNALGIAHTQLWSGWDGGNLRREIHVLVMFILFHRVSFYPDKQTSL